MIANVSIPVQKAVLEGLSPDRLIEDLVLKKNFRPPTATEARFTLARSSLPRSPREARILLLNDSVNYGRTTRRNPLPYSYS